ncbi:TetR/AcrR family transcriptional regulator [Geodermatophilus chilensis]|uniref:TetR/AcrR family transcriptional regulator n=1 Tax=Geodermatophilus chilensis TaxID=2035835 RepID=UPI000C25B24E|nr:TetR/AcrR family transcriptional regulator [Geodermatophilus chilensis]
MSGEAVPVAEPVLTARGRATRERIVAAAAALIHQRGVAGTSLDDVRAVTGTSKSQLYHYFSDKAALVGAVVERQLQQVLQAQQAELDGLDSMAALRRWRDRVVALNRQVGCVGGCPLGRLASELAESDPVARAGLVGGFDTWRERLTAGLRVMQERGEMVGDADPDTLALGLLAAVQGGLLLAQTTRSVTPLEVALDLALAGIESRLARGGPPGR